MKSSFSFLSLSAACGLLALSSSLNAQEPEVPVIGGVSSVSIALTLHTTVAGTVAKDPTTGKALGKKEPGAGPASGNTWEVRNEDTDKKVEAGTEVVTKIAKSKYTNKELLLDLLDQGVIEEIKGWTVVRAQATLVEEEPVITAVGNLIPEFAGPSHLYLVHKTQDPILLDPYVMLMTSGDITSSIGMPMLPMGLGGAMALNTKTVTKFDEEEEPTSTTNTYSITQKGLGAAIFMLGVSLSEEEEEEEEEMPTEGKMLFVAGSFSGGEKLSTFGKDKLPVILGTASKLSPLLGMGVVVEEDDEVPAFHMIEGGISLGAASAKDLTDFPGVTAMIGLPGIPTER